ncbi:MAG: hypothetical protein AAB486_02670 [Patescibacteria group bacterium]
MSGANLMSTRFAEASARRVNPPLADGEADFTWIKRKLYWKFQYSFFVY